VVHATVNGTNTGGFPWLGVEANGKSVSIDFVGVYTLRDGKVTKHYGLNDVFALATQLGALPSPGAVPTTAG
jgi:predicted ester cyclase